jgi:hypothetical protein
VSRNLVIVRAGDNSLHPEWLEGAALRSWDLVVNYYGDKPDLYCVPGVERIDSKGPKWPALHELINANPRFLQDYDYVWLPDDDLRTNAVQINLLFEIMAQYHLQVAQPALTWNSYFGHLTTLRNARFRLRVAVVQCQSQRMGTGFRVDQIRRATGDRDRDHRCGNGATYAPGGRAQLQGAA